MGGIHVFGAVKFESYRCSLCMYFVSMCTSLSSALHGRSSSLRLRLRSIPEERVGGVTAPTAGVKFVEQDGGMDEMAMSFLASIICTKDVVRPVVCRSSGRAALLLLPVKHTCSAS